MREIKFRAWDTNPLPYDKKMLYMDDMTVENIKNQGSYIEKVFNLLVYTGNDRYKLMQYTGLKDKNGVDIYEGDIVKFGNTNDALHSPIDGHSITYANLKGEVIFRKCNFVIANVPSKFNSIDDNYWLGSKQLVGIEVIGSIYEKPDLLK